MKILADTSVWIEHLRRGDCRLAALLRDGRVMTHPFVIGELACGTIGNREGVLAGLAELPRTVMADHEETMHFLESRRLWGLGIGWVDAHLIASALLSGCGLLTLDRRLKQAAQRAGVAAA
jgi:predicted nucleic acid-binding protein